MAEPIILLEDEPLSNALCKWAGWMAMMIVFMMILIYSSSYFAKSSGWAAGEYEYDYQCAMRRY